jgi:hypothetical protein
LSNFEKLKNYSLFGIASFLIKTQLVEFEIKQLITSLDLHLIFSSTSKDLKRKSRTPKYFDDRRMTLGGLCEEISLFDGAIIKSLSKNLKDLVNKRNKFVHCLFNPGKISELINEAEMGLKLANLVLGNIDQINKYLDENDSLGMATRSKKIVGP